MSEISEYRGRRDIHLDADAVANRVIVESLSQEFPDYGIVSEELDHSRWPDNEHVWVIDPLDGTNNFAYGIAHCAISITLFCRDEVVLALIVDPLLNREFYATGDTFLPLRNDATPSLTRATVSLVTNYSDEGQDWGVQMGAYLGDYCKRTVSLWAPALDLALIAAGSLDAMICHNGHVLDVCGGVFLVTSAGGAVLDMDGNPLRLRRSSSGERVSFVAARTSRLGGELLERARSGGFGVG